jgi:pimeloyl-ACP methyl ester carboxylesterase
MRRSSHRVHDLVVTGHEFSVPVDHERPGGDRITVFAREVVREELVDEQLPWLVFFQGGPGGESPRPDAIQPTWLPRGTREYRVLLLDQRGTGLSTPVSARALSGMTPAAQADYLSHFRGDAIVRDAELIRHELAGGKPWTILGQSFGGFCALTYLSFAPEGLEAAVIAGGLAPIDRGADDVYRATYPRVIDRNRRLYERYPEDRERVRRLVERLDAEDFRLPDGTRLTPRRFRVLGIGLGMSNGAERLHYLVERALDYRLLHEMQAREAFEVEPLYALLHEPIYCQGEASRWSAARVAAEFAELEDPTTFTGEMVYPWMFEEYAQLQPLREAAELLAERADWPPLYDPAVLRRN